MNIQYKKYIPTLLFAMIIVLTPSLASAGIYMVSGNGAEVGRENCVVVMDNGTIYEGTGVYDFGGNMSVESAARACLGFVPAGIIASVDGGTLGWGTGSKYTIDDVPNLNNTITYPLLVPSSLSVNTNILIAESTLKTLGLFTRMPDGIFDRASAEAVKNFQKKMSLPMTGTIDKLTWLLLLTR